MSAAGPVPSAPSAPWRHRFVDLIAQLEAATGDRVGIGHLGPPNREVVRLRPHLSLAFPTADVVALKPRADDGGPPWLLETSFLGLYGEASPLPTYVTEALFVDEPNPARDFIDIVNHRLLSLAYRVLRKYRFTRRRELLGVVARLAGIEPGAETPDHLLPYVGLLSLQPRSAGALQAVLSSAFGGVPVEVEQCVPRWTALPSDRLARLGVDNCTLGGDCLLGNHIFNRSTAFGITIGPVEGDLFRRFLPGGDAQTTLAVLVAEFNTEHLDHEVEIAVQGQALAATTLDDSSRLGWDTRLGGTPPDLYRIRITAAA